MRYQYISYIWPLLASALVTLSLGIYAFSKRQNAKGAIGFMLSMAILTLWSVANALEMSAVDFSTKLFWANVQYIAYCYSPVTLLALCMEFTGHDQWVRQGKILLFAIVPTIIIILVWTDGIHGLIRHDLQMNYDSSFPVIDKEYGPAFWVHAVYSQLLNLLAGVLLLRAVFFKNTVYRKQALSLFLGLSLIVILNLMYITGLTPVKQFDITPLIFGPAGLVVAWGIFRYKLFDVVPVARAKIFEAMDSGLMVLDLQDRILDINPALKKILGKTDAEVISCRVEEACSCIPQLANACRDQSRAQSEFSLTANGYLQIFEILISPLIDRRGIEIGRLIVVNEITRRKQKQQQYLKKQWKLAVTEERERLARDMHDNLAQVLAFINLQTQGIQNELAQAGIDIVSNKLDKLVDATQSAHNEIRAYIKNVRCAEYVEKNFVDAMEEMVANFEARAGIKVDLNLPDGFVWKEVNPEIWDNILNIVKEALNNIEKHAEADHVAIVFSMTAQQLHSLITDDGRGFDPEQQASATKSKFGLTIMRERAAEIGGNIKISSKIGSGSRIVLDVPIIQGGRICADEINAG
jgi:PAS domain S-box-containing protein